ncbi:MAG: tRNA (guanosine(37)-N1)-methyltransferase TrmD, partial [Fuerstiella sp.]
MPHRQNPDLTENARDLRAATSDVHRTVDDSPFGGGAGMVLKPDVLGRAIESVGEGRPILAMTPRGKPITQARIREIAEGPGVTILCGRFEG